jgi:hypothetical protein
MFDPFDIFTLDKDWKQNNVFFFFFFSFITGYCMYWVLNYGYEASLLLLLLLLKDMKQVKLILYSTSDDIDNLCILGTFMVKFGLG